MHYFSHKGFKVTILLVLLWGISTYFVANNYFSSRIRDLVKQENLKSQEHAIDLADSIQRNLHYLNGVTQLLAHLSRVNVAITRLNASSATSKLPYDARKKHWTEDFALKDISQYFKFAKSSLNVDLIYLIDGNGDCLAASNWAEPDSPIGTNFQEREFFKKNKAGLQGMQYAVGKTTHIAGLYFSSPIMINGKFMGAVVAKIEIPNLSFLTAQTDAYVADKNGVVILAREKSMEMHVIPNAVFSALSRQDIFNYYQRNDIPVLEVENWNKGKFGPLYLIKGEDSPHVIAHEELSEYGLTVNVEGDLPSLPIMIQEKNWIPLLFSLCGGLLIIIGRNLMFNFSERKQAEENQRIAAAAFESQEGMMITDADCIILRINQAFTENSGYTPEEIVGQTPSILKSGRHDADFYRSMWDSINQTGSWQGEIWDRRKNGEIYPKWLNITAVKGSDGVVTHYVGSDFDISERKKAEEKIRHLAFFDPLTQLPNRRLLIDRLNHALSSSARNERYGALLFIDLDNFKTLNDTLGHDVGDLLLKQVAERLVSCIREGDTVARFGGDEFVVLLEDLSKDILEAAAQTDAISEKMLAALSIPFRLALKEHFSTSSIGMTLLNGHQLSIEELLKQADIAMYQAKKAGRNTQRFFDRQMQESINVRTDIEAELRKALENKQFHLYYQIQVDSSHCTLGAETLIRWIHPERGFVSPAQFIPLAEETGLILPIGQWVLETACAQLAAWKDNALTRNLTLSVNISAKQLNQADFVAQVQNAVRHHAINANLLKLELTESLLVDSIEKTIATMNELSEVGVQLSLDDFGTGFSSLQYLKRLPLDQLKIDQSFVRDIAVDSNDKAIVRTIIAMAHSLNLGVIAEGVETEEQQQFLLDNGCTHYQGYLFGRPLPINKFEASLK